MKSGDRFTALPETAADWHRRVWALAGPIILSNMSVPLVGAVDTAVVGHLPDPAFIGAVAIGAVIFDFLYWGFGFLRMGTTGFVAQAFGAGDADEVRATLARALLLAGVLGMLLVLAQAPVGAAAFLALQGSADVESLAQSYYAVRIWSAPAALANYALLGFLIAVQNTRAALVVQLLLNTVNVLLDLLFVVVLEMDVRGVALASVLSQYVALAAGAGIAAHTLGRIGGRLHRRRITDAARLAALVRVNADIFLRTLCLIFAFAYFTNAGARAGDVVLAANAVLMHMVLILAFGLDGFAHAAEALAGGAYGARRLEAFRAAVRSTTLWAAAVAVAYALLYAGLGPWIVDLLTDIESVRRTAYRHLPWMVVFPLVSVWCFQLDGIFIGTTRTVEMRNGMVLSLAAYLAAIHFLPGVLGNHGLWLSLALFMVARGVTLGLWYPRIEAALRR